jgi:hypothetical protein
MIKSRRMSWAGHVTGMGRKGMYIGNWWESQKDRGHWEDQDEGGLTILKWILERSDGMAWTGSIYKAIHTFVSVYYYSENCIMRSFI